MITNSIYKTYAGQIANLFCENQANKSICIASIKERIINNFNNTSFQFFLEHLSRGRFYIVEISQWKVVSGCRNMGFTLKVTDVVTGSVEYKSVYYTNENCEGKQWYFPDLNHAVQVKSGYKFLDAPIQSNNTQDIIRPRLTYKENAPSYNIVYVPQTGGSGGTTIPTPQPVLTPSPEPVQAGTQQSGFNMSGIFDNPLLLVGLGLGFFFLLKD